MKLTLLTYDSVLVQNLGYLHVSQAFEFAKKLELLATEFALIANVDKNEIYWMEVRDSDWCQNTVVLYAKVAHNWKPIEETFVFGNTRDKDNYPHLDSNLYSYLKGGGNYVNNIENPPKQPHELYKSNQK